MRSENWGLGRLLLGEDLGTPPARIHFEYVGYKIPHKGECFIGGGGSFHEWRWDDHTDRIKNPKARAKAMAEAKKQHCYRRYY